MESKISKTVGVIGSSSMVGSRYCEQASNDFDLVKADLSGQILVDITDAESTDEFFKKHQFANAILFSAFTDVDAAEKQRGDKSNTCWRVNVNGVENVVAACLKYQRGLIFISTSFVFDGTAGPYAEDSPFGPDLEKVSWYGITKIEAENIIKSQLSQYLIIRIAYPYRAGFEGKDDFAKRILRNYHQGSLPPMFFNQALTPTFVDDLAPAIKLLITENQSQIFHLASPQITTPYEFALYLNEVFGGDPAAVQKGSIVDFLKRSGATPRTVNGALSVKRISRLGFHPTGWRQGIKIIHGQSGGRLI